MPAPLGLLFVVYALLLVLASGAHGGTFPGANGKIVYTSHQGGNVDIYARNADGTGLVRLTTDVNIENAPSVSADGTKIAYASKQGGGEFEIYSMNADGTGKTNLTANAAADYDPSWSPDGTKIAFTSNRSGSVDVWVMNADGTGLVNLTPSSPTVDHEPTWSPDGTQIAFTSGRSGNLDVWVMGATGLGPVNRTAGSATEDQQPVWSPNGAQIAFSSKRSGNYDIWTMNADGTGLTNRTIATVEEDVEPSYSPDGVRIAFTSNRSGNFDVWLMSSGGDSFSNLTAPNTQEDQLPDWSTVSAPPPAPSVTASSPASPANDNDPEISGTAQAGATVHLYTNATCTSAVAATGTAAAFGSPGLTVTVANDSVTTFWATATDANGTSACSSTSVTFVEDSTPAQSTIDSGPSGPTNDPTPTFGFSSDEPGSSFECRVDGGPWGPCSSPHTAAGLADGPHSFEVRAIDPAGNVDGTPASRAFTVDTNNPQSTIDSGPSGPTNDPTPTFGFSSDEPGSSFECRVDGGPWGPCSSPHTTAGLADGPHSFEVRAIDPAGNVDPTPASVTFTIATDAGDDSLAPPPPPSPPSPSPPGNDLSSLPGSLVGDGSCQRLGPGLGTTRRRVRGIGRVRVRLSASGLVMADDPLNVTVQGPRKASRRLRSVRYELDGRRLRGARGEPFPLAIKPDTLGAVGDHVLRLQLKPARGKARTASVELRTYGCEAAFRASQRKTPSGSKLKLRIDTRRAASGVTFRLPRRMLPNLAAGRRAGSLRTVAASIGTQKWKLAFGRKPDVATLLADGQGPKVTLEGNTVTVSRLAAQTGIVDLSLLTKRSSRPRALVARGSSAKLSAQISGEAPQQLAYQLRGKGRR